MFHLIGNLVFGGTLWGVALFVSGCSEPVQGASEPVEEHAVTDEIMAEEVAVGAPIEMDLLEDTVPDRRDVENTAAVVVETYTAPRGLNLADHWVATDALGRSLPTYAETGDLRGDRWVGMFYYIWVGNHTRKVFDISKIIQDPKADRKWGPVNQFHFWGEPEYGYYHASDPWVIRHDMSMLANAGVDFIHFDTTNGPLYLNTVEAVCEVIAQMRSEGLHAPSITFTTNANSGRTMNEVYDEFYAKKRYQDLWFRWQGKPLMLGHVDDPVLRPEVRDFFTIKKSWVAPRKPAKDQWNWLSFYPQSYGFGESRDVPEHVPVAVAFHPNNPRGKSYHNGKQPSVDSDYMTPYTHKGPHFEEQFLRAREVDPKVITVTQWNEWLAQRKLFTEERFANDKDKKYAGNPIEYGDTMFVDVWNMEFNRDIAPMKGGYTDSYYYQLVNHIRHFKGMQPPKPRPEMRTMQIDGEFAEWDTVTTKHWDPIGDTLHRDYEGTDPETRYTNTTGRNDIIGAKVAHDREYAYFMVETNDALSPHTDQGWMLLFIDTDQNKSTGWEGYDIALNRHGVDANQTTVDSWGGGQWQSAGKADLAYNGNHLELRVPVRYFRGSNGGFDFKWMDNPQHLTDASTFFLDGDAAPDRRFNYRY